MMSSLWLIFISNVFPSNSSLNCTPASGKKSLSDFWMCQYLWRASAFLIILEYSSKRQQLYMTPVKKHHGTDFNAVPPGALRFFRTTHFSSVQQRISYNLAFVIGIGKSVIFCWVLDRISMLFIMSFLAISKA